jgi:hypothetical protein
MTTGGRFANRLIKPLTAQSARVGEKYRRDYGARGGTIVARHAARGLRNKRRRSGTWIDASAKEEGFIES